MQLSIFEIPEPDVIPFDIGDRVRVIVPELKKGSSMEHFYLLKFDRKRGVITKVVNLPSLQYHVDFDGKEAIIYHHELTFW